MLVGYARPKVDPGSQVFLEPYTAGDNDASGPVTARLQFRTDGTVHSVGDFSGDQLLSTWKLSGSAGDYEIFVTTDSGTVTGTVGSWVSLAVQFELSKTRSTAGAATWLGNIQIRHAVTHDVLAAQSPNDSDITVDIS
jgi:hypothetical protein